jgi:hypothetical protein
MVAAASVNAMVDALKVLCNGGTIKIYSGTQPATADTAVPGGAVLLATCTFSATAFGSSTAGVVTANAIASDTDADATGTASWFRALTSGGAKVFDGSVGVGGSFDCNVPGTSVVQHQVVAISSMTLAAPES